MSKWCVFAAEWGGVCMPAPEHPSDERARNWHSAASESSLTLPQLGEAARAPREGCYCLAWLNKRRDEVGWLTDEVGTSPVSMHWSSGELEPVKQNGSQIVAPPPAVNNLLHTGDAKATNAVITPIARGFDPHANVRTERTSSCSFILNPLLHRLPELRSLSRKGSNN